MQIYKGYSYLLDKDGLWKVLLDESLFVVAMDDSKICNLKRIIPEKNNENTCKRFIDWLSR